MIRSGFTLIELSIVLVIVGLVIGGILVGQDLIHAAQIRATIAQIEKYNTAVNTFKAKYNCLPGDCANATDLFGTDPYGCDNGSTYASTPRTIGTCNGDGDGAIGGACIPGTDCEEPFHAFQMLSIAGMMDQGVFMQGGGSYPFDWVGVTVPKSKLRNNIGIAVHYYSATNGGCCSDMNGSAFTNAHSWTVGSTMAGGLLMGWGISANEARMFDTKMDDGLAISGGVQAPNDNQSPINYGSENGDFHCANTSGVYYNVDDFSSAGDGSANPGCFIVVKAAF